VWGIGKKICLALWRSKKAANRGKSAAAFLCYLYLVVRSLFAIVAAFVVAIAAIEGDGCSALLDDEGDAIVDNFDKSARYVDAGNVAPGGNEYDARGECGDEWGVVGEDFKFAICARCAYAVGCALEKFFVGRENADFHILGVLLEWED